LHGGDPRWQRVPDAAAVAAAGMDDLAALIGQDFATGPIEVTVVGDVATDQAIDAVARSYGALPTRPARLAPGPAAATVRVPQANAALLVVPHSGRADQAMAMAAWPTDDFFADPQTQRVLNVTAAIVESRLTDRLRISEGVTYSPSVDTDTSRVFKGFGDIRAVVETPVDKVDNFYAELDSIVAAVQSAPPSSDEMERAKRPMVDQRIKLLRENAYWLSVLSAAQGNALQLDAIRDLVSGTEKVTAEEVELAAQRFLTKGTEFRMVVQPESAK
jgi:zinc protease